MKAKPKIERVKDKSGLAEKTKQCHNHNYESGTGHHLQLRAGGNTIPAGANAVAAVREAAGSRVLSARLQYAVLFGETGVKFATRTGGSGASRQPKPSFHF